MVLGSTSEFGLAQISISTSTHGTQTLLAGSPGFQSPEQLRAISTGPPSDMYAFGGVLVGKSPVWPALTPFRILHKGLFHLIHVHPLWMT